MQIEAFQLRSTKFYKGVVTLLRRKEVIFYVFVCALLPIEHLIVKVAFFAYLNLVGPEVSKVWVLHYRI